MLFVALIVFGGRVVIAHQAVQSAAAQAARTASIARTPGDAQSSAVSQAGASLDSQNVHCTRADVSVDTSGFAAPVGTPATVRATVTCAVNIGDLALPGVPGSITITETMTSPIDTYRAR